MLTQIKTYKAVGDKATNGFRGSNYFIAEQLKTWKYSAKIVILEQLQLHLCICIFGALFDASI